MDTKTAFLVLTAPLFLAACEQDRIQTICETSPQFCTELHKDSWCNLERSSLIRARHQQAGTPDDANHYALMVNIKRYHDCLDPLLSIEYTKRKERKNDKLEAVIKAKAALTQLEQQTLDSDYPYLLLWHWQHRGDRLAKARFIKQADMPEMQQPDLQNALAELLIIRDGPAAMRALHRALSLYEAEATVDTDIIANLLTLYIRERRYRDVWIWSRVLSRLDHSATLNMERIDTYARFNKAQQQQMQQEVDTIIHQLATGSYSRS